MVWMSDAHQTHASLMEYLKELPHPRINRTKDHDQVGLLDKSNQITAVLELLRLLDFWMRQPRQ